MEFYSLMPTTDNNGRTFKWYRIHPEGYLHPILTPSPVDSEGVAQNGFVYTDWDNIPKQILHQPAVKYAGWLFALVTGVWLTALIVLYLKEVL